MNLPSTSGRQPRATIVYSTLWVSWTTLTNNLQRGFSCLGNTRFLLEGFWRLEERALSPQIGKFISTISDIYTQTYLSSGFFKVSFTLLCPVFPSFLTHVSLLTLFPFPQSDPLIPAVSPPSLSHIPSHLSNVPCNIPGLYSYCRTWLRSEDLVPQASDARK